MFHNRFISSRFKHEVRTGETPHFDAWFASHGFTVEHLPADMFFEGAGDALFCGSTLFAGYRIRSDVHSHNTLAKILGKMVLPLELVDPRFYHLDTCFCPTRSRRSYLLPSRFRRLWPQVAGDAHSAAAAGA